ncbi:MAG: P13 family porin [Treponema sp.]|nr:P13 family porin [Treponema sp.]
MKKIISILSVLTLAVFTGFAQNASDLFAPTETVPVTISSTASGSAESVTEGLPEELLDALKKPWVNGDVISNLTAGYTLNEKTSLYNEFEKSKGKAIGLNWLGFGIGSFTQGDGLGGGLGLTFDLLGYGTMLVGTGFLAVGIVIIPWIGVAEALGGGNESGEGSQELESIINTGVGLFAAGCILWLGNRIFGTIRPITFQKKYNNSLKSALGLDGIIEDLSFVPIVNPVESQYGLLTHITF